MLCCLVCMLHARLFQRHKRCLIIIAALSYPCPYLCLQRDCQDLDAAVRELQRQVQHQHHHNTNNSQHQQQQPADGSAAIHSSSQGVRLDQVELQLADCRRQLVEAKTAAAESAAALAAERAARVAAEDREAGRRGLMERLTTLQAEVEGLHAALLQEKRGVVALRDELGLMTTSRDTWRVRVYACKRVCMSACILRKILWMVTAASWGWRVSSSTRTFSHKICFCLAAQAACTILLLSSLSSFFSFCCCCCDWC